MWCQHAPEGFGLLARTIATVQCYVAAGVKGKGAGIRMPIKEDLRLWRHHASGAHSRSACARTVPSGCGES